MIADMWQSGNEVLAVHCLPHQGNLALGTTLKLLGVWLSHVRAAFSWFEKSVKRKEAFKALYAEFLAEMQVLFESMGALAVDYPRDTLNLPVKYCVMRWLGLKKCCEHLLLAWPALQKLKSKLIDDGGGAPVESGQVDPFGNDSSDGDFDPDDIDNADDDRAVGWRSDRVRIETRPGNPPPHTGTAGVLSQTH